MKIILIIAYLLLSFLLPAQATEHSFLSWLANDWHRSTLGRVIHNFADNKVMSGFDVLIFDQNPPPPDNVKNALESIKSPVATSFLAYCKLYNKTVDKNNYFSNGIAWSYLVIRIHQAENNDNKTGAVTGWYVGASGADYQTLGAFKDVSGAFIGSWSRSKEDSPLEFDWKLVNKKGETPDAEGFEHFIGIADPDNATICGDWKGYCERLKIQDMDHQYGTMSIITGRLYPEDYSFAMNKVTRDPTWNEVKIKRILNNYSNMAAIFGPGCSPDFLNHKEQEQIVAYYVHKAWATYAENLPSDIKSKKGAILDFEVNLKHQFVSNDKVGKDGQKLPVPMLYGRLLTNDPWRLQISTGTFFTDMAENEKQFKSRLSLIAHEILGHGIFFRYYWPFIEKESEILFNSNLKPITLVNKPQQCINKGSAITAIKEGLAVAVEYTVYQKEKNICINLSDFMQTRYTSEQAAMYKLGVEFLIQEGIINKDGKLDFSKINN